MMSDSRSGEYLYLDSALWIDLAEGRHDADFLQIISDRRLIPVLSSGHLSDFSQADRDGRSRITQYVDNVRGRCKVVWIRKPTMLQEMEAEAAFLTWLGMTPPSVDPYGVGFVDVVESSLSWRDRAEGAIQSVESLVEIMIECGAFRDYTDFRRQHPSDRRRVRAASANPKTISPTPCLHPTQTSSPTG